MLFSQSVHVKHWFCFQLFLAIVGIEARYRAADCYSDYPNLLGLHAASIANSGQHMSVRDFLTLTRNIEIFSDIAKISSKHFRKVANSQNF